MPGQIDVTQQQHFYCDCRAPVQQITE